ncbi:Uncharacterised protein [Campylobacter geochelonis]|uniref:Uncharacterized protein n=1 Tax=Campylobacter geochelonis TaxID=1780362 RepID=A0A128EDQ1_9BACT|nr:Uncharacterised protein [Campylobacter geochelonis]
MQTQVEYSFNTKFVQAKSMKKDNEAEQVICFNTKFVQAK